MRISAVQIIDLEVKLLLQALKDLRFLGNGWNPGSGEFEFTNYRGTGNGGWSFWEGNASRRVLHLQQDGLAMQYSTAGTECSYRFNSNGQSSVWWVIGMEANNNFKVFNNNGVGVYMGYGGTGWTGYSDRRLKRDIVEISTGQLDKIASLKPVTYRWKTDPENQDATTKKRQGFIAQDVLEVFPQVIDETSEWLSITVTDLIPYMVSAIKELKKRNEDLSTQVDELKALVNSKL